MHKFKVGDVVRLKTVKELDEEYRSWRDNFWVTKSMEDRHLGKHVVIKSQETLGIKSSPGYCIVEDVNEFVYFEELFIDPYEEIKAISMEFSFDDLIK